MGITKCTSIPISKADESGFVCNRGQLALLAAGLNFALYFVAFISAAYLLSCVKLPLNFKRRTKIQLSEAQKGQLTNTLELISKYLKSPVHHNEEKMIASR